MRFCFSIDLPLVMIFEILGGKLLVYALRLRGGAC